MNHENMQKLIDWLEAGAPEVEFDMNRSVVLKKWNPKELSACGSVCCIAGAAYQMSLTPDGSFPKIETVISRTDIDNSNTDSQGNVHAKWPQISEAALKFLGLPDLQHDEEYYYEFDAVLNHPLFDPLVAPEGCRPQQAAQACRNLMDGAHPLKIWDNVTA